MGDININCLDSNREQTALEEILLSHNITRVALPPTRITPTSQTSIDCVCSNLEDKELTVKVLHEAISDHSAQLSTVNFYPQDLTPSLIKKRNFTGRSIAEIKSKLAQESWNELKTSTSTDFAYNFFNRTVNMIINHACPFKYTTLRKKTRTRVSDAEIDILRDEFLKALSHCMLTGTLEHKQEAALKKKDYDLKLKAIRRHATSEQIALSDNKSKAIWTVINRERKSKISHGPRELIDPTGEVITDPQKMADFMNTVFVRLADNALAANPKLNQAQVTSNSNAPSLYLHPTTVREVKGIIYSLKSKTSAGIDDISSKLLKDCCNQLAYPLTLLINLSLKEGRFPSDLKLAKVIPIPKQGNASEACNYRPISLLPTFSKVFEKVVLCRLLKHLADHELLTAQQHGFIKGRSTTSAIISLVETIIDKFEAGDTTTTILLDFSKAFDCLDHDQLLMKLKYFGITGTTASWFKSYLTNRQQMVELKHTDKGRTGLVRSKPQSIARGVPQGSVLGPVLFILFTSDLPGYLEKFSTAIMYADDTALLLSDKIPDRLEISSHIAVEMAIQYCHRNNLVINEAKSKQLIMGRRKEEVGPLPNTAAVAVAKYLGVVIDENLSWTPHIDDLCKKLSTGLYVVKRIKEISDVKTATIAYNAVFDSHLRYGLCVWGNSSVQNLQRPLVLQKKCIRILAGMQSRESCRTVFVEFNIMTVVSLYILQVILYAIDKNLTRGSDLHAHNTRYASNFSLPAHRLTLFEEKPSYMGAKLFNMLPDDIKLQKGSLNFKKLLRRWLLNHPFYAIEEFINWRTEWNTSS